MHYRFALLSAILGTTVATLLGCGHQAFAPRGAYDPVAYEDGRRTAEREIGEGNPVIYALNFAGGPP